MTGRRNGAEPSERASRAGRRRTRTKYWPWLSLALFGIACAGVFGGDDPSVGDDVTLRFTPETPAPHTTTAVVLPPAARSPAPVEPKAPAPAPRAAEKVATPLDREDSGLDESPVETRAPAPEPAEASRAFDAASLALLSGPNVPGQTWQEAANMADWPSVAQLIDALPADQRDVPGTRYARAVAGREIGQCDVALRVLVGLENELPLLSEEIGKIRAECQLEVGPYEDAYQYFTRDPSPENLILATRAALNGADVVRAEQTIERAFQKIRSIGSESKRGRKNEIAARVLRARVLETKGDRALAARDWFWLATLTPTEEAANNADETYERLSGQRLTKGQRFERMRTFSRAGDLEHTLRERSQLASAPGPAPAEVDVTSNVAWAYYYSRRDYEKAAELFRQAADLSIEGKVRNLFFEARALSRANQDERAIARYTDLIQRFPGNEFTEQAYYRIARLQYDLGKWNAAEQAYAAYLDRYGRTGGGRYAAASRYELSISRLAAKERTEEASQYLGQLARKERQPERQAMFAHLEALGLELTREPNKMLEAIQRYRAVIETQPLSSAAMMSAARLRGLGRPEVQEERLRSVNGSELAAPPGYLESDLPEKARVLAALGLHTDAERALFDQRAEVSKRYLARDGQALCEMYASLDRGFRSISLADSLKLKGEQLRSLPSADNLWAWRCAYPKPYREIVTAVEERYRLPGSLVHAVMRQESWFRPNVVSPVGAIGLMQLMPGTALRAAEEITQQPGAPWVPDPRRPTNVLNNVELGGFYLGKLLGMLNGQLPIAVAAYNAGPVIVSRWLEKGDDLPLDVWLARIPYTETRDYVSHVLSNWLAYRYLEDPKQLPEMKLALIPGTRATPDAY
jgi:soluble lytic murein transglycosylase